MKDKLHNSALDLSGRQRSSARTLAIKPEVILFDEPCRALDPISTAKIEDLINNLKRDYTIVILTNNMHKAAQVSDYTAFFLLGELIECAGVMGVEDGSGHEELNSYSLECVVLRCVLPF